jgi:hypothetical protein
VVFVRQDGEERKLSYEEFIRDIREGRIVAETIVRSEVLTSGEWKPAGQMRLFQAWVPKTEGATEEEPPATRSGLAEEVEPGEGDEIAGEPELPVGALPEEDEEPWPRPDTGEADRETPDADAPSRVPRYSEIEPDDETAPGDPIPWELAERIGFGTALYATLWLAFRNTDEFFRRIARTQVLFPPLLFGLILFAITNIADGAYGYLILTRLGGAMEEVQRAFPGVFDEGVVTSPKDILFSHGALVLFYPALVFLWGGVIHLLLTAFDRSARPWGMTIRLVNYAMAPLILSVIPVCGNIAGWIWVLVLLIRGLVRVHHVGMGTAALAVLLPVLLPICLAASSLAQPLAQLLSVPGGGF